MVVTKSPLLLLTVKRELLILSINSLLPLEETLWFKRVVLEVTLSVMSSMT